MNADSRTETIRMIADSAAFAGSREQVTRARHLRGNATGFDRAFWSQAADMGWLGLRVPEAAGGIGLGLQELCAVSEQLGHGLAPEPLIAAISVAPLLTGDTLAEVVQGRAVVLPAWREPGLRADAPAQTTFDGERVTGTKSFVYMAAGADRLLVTTRHGLALVDAQAPGVTISTAALQDGGHFGTVRFENAAAEPVPGSFDEVLEEMTVATAAYLLGVMRHSFAITADYLSTRRQFDRVIGSFQSLQHRMADLYIQISLAAASVARAAAVLDGDPSGEEGVQAVSRAKARTSDAAMLVTRQGIQLHGGIGFIDEADIGLFLRKALTLANMHGSSAEHRERYARCLQARPLGTTA